MTFPIDLANELVLNIFQNLPYKDLYQCLQVNKSWFKVSQLILYREISIDIGFQDEIYDNLMLNTLVHSKFTPGDRVKKITIARLKVPDNIFAFDLYHDPLYLIMTHCPSVEEFCFEPSNFILTSEWTYLSNVFQQQNSIWKLRNFAAYFASKDYMQYYACACLMRDTLTHYYLKKSLPNDNMYGNHFKGFDRLTTLSISRKVIENIVHSDKIISCLPKLINVEISFYIPPPNPNQRTKNNTAYKFTSKTEIYPNIKSLTLKNTPLSSDNELMYIIDKFVKLTDLNIKFGKGKPWPITKITPEVLKTFFQYLNYISNYTVAFKDVDLVFILNEYLKYKREINSLANIKFGLTLTQLLDQGLKSASLELCNNSIAMSYNTLNNRLEERMTKIHRMLNMIAPDIEDISITVPRTLEVKSFISDMLKCCCSHMQKVVFIGGDFTDLFGVEFAESRIDYVKHFTFRRSSLYIYLLDPLFTFISSLETLCFDNCTFFNVKDNRYKISFPLLKVNKFTLSFDEIGIPGIKQKEEEFNENKQQDKKVAVAFIELSDGLGNCRYFFGEPENEDLMELTKDMYVINETRFREEEQFHVVSISLSFASLQSFTLITPVKVNTLLFK